MATKRRKLNNQNNESLCETPRKRKRCITEGDAKLETVRILTFIQEISDTLCEVLNDYTTQLNNEDDRPTKARIISHYKFLKDAGRSLNEGILNISKLQKQKLIIASLISG